MGMDTGPADAVETDAVEIVLAVETLADDKDDNVALADVGKETSDNEPARS